MRRAIAIAAVVFAAYAIGAAEAARADTDNDGTGIAARSDTDMDGTDISARSDTGAEATDVVARPDTGADAAAILRAATSLFPVEPVALYGSLIVRRQSGVIVREIPFAMSLDWGASPPVAEYTLMDSFGRTLSSARVTRNASGVTALECLDSEGKQVPAPPLTAQILGTDITWLDITLAYLWWEDATLLAPETFKGSLCDVVEVRPPAPIEGCAAVRLWIDRKHAFLRQAEQLGPDGTRVRWMWVASVGKIGGRWMIRNLEVKRPGTGFQTKLHVDDLDTP